MRRMNTTIEYELKSLITNKSISICQFFSDVGNSYHYYTINNILEMQG